MRLRSLVFGNDPAQALRINRFFLGSSAYLHVAALTAYAMWHGLLPDFPQWALLIVPLIPIVFFYALFRSGFNLRFKDKSLAIPQLSYSTLSFIFVLYFANEARGALMILYVTMQMASSFKLPRRQFFIMGILPIVILGGMIFLQTNDGRTQRYTPVEIMQLMALACVIPWFSYVGGYINRKRDELHLANAKLGQALFDNIELVDQLRKQKHIAESANLAKSRFLAAASHDLRQPLHALTLFVAQLRGAGNSADNGDIVAKISSSVTAINELFDDLLDISKLDAGMVNPKLSDFPVRQLLKRLENTFDHITLKKHLRLQLRADDLWIRSEQILLERILMNLVSNAVRCTERGGVLIACRRRGDFLRIEVWDSGRGIPEDQQREIFREFYQITNTGSEETAGLGLGLAIVERLCGILKHPIEVRSVVGKGSRFSVTVPIVAPLAPAAQVQTPVAVLLGDFDQARGKLIVVIDDEILVREAMRGLLHSWGCEVILAESADTALDSLVGNGRTPDLIISDYRLLDGQNGIAAIERIRAVTQTNVPAFLISGGTGVDQLRKVHALGYTMLHKPVTPLKLRALLNQHLA
ncbi:MAG: hybrid sensor histidine kinase/response regulator [Pseudomonadota bacterium]